MGGVEYVFGFWFWPWPSSSHHRHLGTNTRVFSMSICLSIPLPLLPSLSQNVFQKETKKINLKASSTCVECLLCFPRIEEGEEVALPFFLWVHRSVGTLHHQIIPFATSIPRPKWQYTRLAQRAVKEYCDVLSFWWKKEVHIHWATTYVGELFKLFHILPAKVKHRDWACPPSL